MYHLAERNGVENYPEVQGQEKMSFFIHIVLTKTCIVNFLGSCGLFTRDLLNEAAPSKMQ
jgi:hypothetical protein